MKALVFMALFLETIISLLDVNNTLLPIIKILQHTQYFYILLLLGGMLYTIATVNFKEGILYTVLYSIVIYQAIFLILCIYWYISSIHNGPLGENFILHSIVGIGFALFVSITIMKQPRIRKILFGY